MRILITGASSGIGSATARRFAKEGHTLILAARRVDKLQALSKELGEKAHVLKLDITKRSDVEKAFDQIGPIDVLVNNAGLAPGLNPAQTSHLDEWETCVDVNIKGLLYCSHSVLPGMVKRNKGHIINLGSVAGNHPYPGGNVYCGTKAFVRQFSLCLRSDLSGTNVRVSCIEPGLTGGTEFSDVRFHGDQAKVKGVYENAHPLMPEDIAETIFFCVNAPLHVNINSIELMPLSQAFAPLSIHRQERDQK